MTIEGTGAILYMKAAEIAQNFLAGEGESTDNSVLSTVLIVSGIIGFGYLGARILYDLTKYR